MTAFAKLGFVGLKPLATRPHWEDSWGCTEGQRAKIEALWRSVARNKSDHALRTFIKRIAHVDSPHWLNVQLAQKVILALEKMREAGAPQGEA
jgi:hypothetical protein